MLPELQQSPCVGLLQGQSSNHSKRCHPGTPCHHTLAQSPIPSTNFLTVFSTISIKRLDKATKLHAINQALLVNLQFHRNFRMLYNFIHLLISFLFLCNSLYQTSILKAVQKWLHMCSERRAHSLYYQCDILHLHFAGSHWRYNLMPHYTLVLREKYWGITESGLYTHEKSYTQKSCTARKYNENSTFPTPSQTPCTSQNRWGWKGLLKIIQSNPLF